MREKKVRPQVDVTTDSVSPRAEYDEILAGLTKLIDDSRRQTVSAVNRELVRLYWQIGLIIGHQQENGAWGDSVVEQLSADLRSAFPDMRGLTHDNLFRMRKFVQACLEIGEWLDTESSQPTEAKELTAPANGTEKLGTASPLFPQEGSPAIVGTACPQTLPDRLADLVFGISWSHHRLIVARCESPAERYFYMKMSATERWSVRELRRQIDSVLFTRYVSASEHPEKCLPAEAESGDLLPFRDHYILEFLGLEEEHSEKQLRHAILSNLRDFFLEFGRDLTFVGEEYPLAVGNDTFSIDLLFFHRRLRCLVAVDLKKGEFKPEYVGKSCFYCAALDEQIRLDDENPSIGLVLCKSADSVQVRLALTDAANRIGVATYQTGLPDERLIQQRLQQLRLNDFEED